MTTAAILRFTPHGAHPTTGEAWAEVTYMSGRTELPIAAIVAFSPDPTVEEHWKDIFKGLGIDS